MDIPEKKQHKKKSVAITEKKWNQYVRQIIYINQGHFPTKVTLVIDFTYEPVIQCDVPVVENTFVCRWLQLNDKNGK